MSFAKVSYRICTPTFLKCFLELEALLSPLYEQPYLVQSMLFACSYYTLLLKKVKDKRHHICFDVRNSQVLWVVFVFLFFPPGEGIREVILQITQGFYFWAQRQDADFMNSRIEEEIMNYQTCNK